MLSNGLVTENAVGDSRGGRPPLMLMLNPDAGAVVGVKLTETHVVTALVDLNAEVRHRLTISHTGISDPENVADAVNQAVTRLLRTSGVSSTKLQGVGVGLAGIIDAGGEVLRYSPIFDWHNVAIRQLLHKRLRVPVYIDNDVNTLTMTAEVVWCRSRRGQFSGRHRGSWGGHGYCCIRSILPGRQWRRR
jgi:hypothetical protein